MTAPQVFEVLRCRHCGTIADVSDVEQGFDDGDCCWKGPEWDQVLMLVVGPWEPS